MSCGIINRSIVKAVAVIIITTLQLGIQPALAENGKNITLIHLSDVHCHILPHDEDFLVSGNRTNSGGVAKLATSIKSIREDVGEDNSLLFMVGDATHGGAECTFTLGNAIMPIFNAFRIDAFVMGNWDFAYGNRTTRNRYRDQQKGKVQMSVNNQTTLSSLNPNCTGTAGPADCNVIAANYDTVANNVYNFNEKAQGADRKINTSPANRTFKPWVIKEANGIKVGFIGITTTRLPVQNPLFNLSFRFTKGFDELPQDIADAKAAGAEIIVVATELGLGDNVQIAKEIDGIDIILSGDTHEAMVDPMLVTRPSGEQTLIVESGEDSYLGRLDLKVTGSGKIIKYNFQLLEMTDEVEEDTSDFFVAGGIKALVEENVKTFYSGPDFKCHTFGNGGFPFGKGHTLCTPLDAVVGYTEVELERRDVIGDFMNNFIGDAALYAGKTYAGLSDDNSFGITNGFRYDIPILAQGTPLDGPDGGVADGAITVGELYNFIPISPAASLMEYSGGALRSRYEGFLEGIFDPHPFRHQGGWWMGFSSNMHFFLDLESAPNSVPLSTVGGRILEMTVGSANIDAGKVYTVISCYPHGEGSDRQCRTSGGRNLRFFCGDFNPDPNTRSVVGICPPVNTENIVDPTRSPVVLQVAPDNYFAPVPLLREYFKTLPNKTITAAQFGPPRRSTVAVPFNGCPDNPPAVDKDCDGVPDSDFGEVQPVFGAGPSWLGRGENGATVERIVGGSGKFK
ncbi:bifunctional metallophosphatase/5'-nucleotidase [Kaarinaea lacus]